MEVIKFNEAMCGKNSDVCKTLEYSFDNKCMDLGIATINGRFPDSGYAYNMEVAELVYVLEGNGKLYFKDKVIEFSKGDAILIEAQDKYYYETDYAVLALLCTPAWSPSQHKIEE